MSMTAHQRYWWRIGLELKLRKCHGDAFQDFFCTVMLKAHGDDFVRVRAFGRLGDKGCDGYLQSSGQVFQCYGALDGGSNGKVAYLIGKMGDDYAKAAKAIAAIMKEWHMVHNFVDGLPIEAVEKLEEIRKTDKERKFGFISMEGFEARIFALDIAKIEDLLGPAATAGDATTFSQSSCVISLPPSLLLPTRSNPISNRSGPSLLKSSSSISYLDIGTLSSQEDGRTLTT